MIINDGGISGCFGGSSNGCVGGSVDGVSGGVVVWCGSSVLF
jgi:hypothetical protein